MPATTDSKRVLLSVPPDLYDMLATEAEEKDTTIPAMLVAEVAKRRKFRLPHAIQRGYRPRQKKSEK